MFLKIDTTPRLMTAPEADRVSREMAKFDPDWKYVVEPPPNGEGYCRVKVLDEDGEFVAYLTSTAGR